MKQLIILTLVAGVVVGLAAAATLTILLSSPSVARGDEPVEVSFRGCAEAGSQEVPVGAALNVSGGWVAHRPGLVRSFLSAADLSLSVDGTPISNANDLYGPTIDVGDMDGDGDSEFGTFWTLTLGPLEAGESYVVYMSLGLTHPIIDGGDYNGDGRPDRFGPGENLWSGTCTLMATAP